MKTPMRPLLAGLLAAAVATTSSCGLLGSEEEKPTVAVEASVVAKELFDAQFTRDGTFQSHVEVNGAKSLDFVYTLYPTKATPRTNEWYPGGDKFFSFTFQAYDMAQPLRAPFDTKRKVYLSKVVVTSATTTSDGGATEHPYKLDTLAPKATFDPEPVTTEYGMLVTSPKGAFELRNQRIGPVSEDTIGVTLQMVATIMIETEAGSEEFFQRKVRQNVPIAIFPSDTDTEAADIPVNAN